MVVVVIAGLFYSTVIGILVATKEWGGAVALFCYGLALLGARIVQLLERKPSTNTVERSEQS